MGESLRDVFAKHFPGRELTPAEGLLLARVSAGDLIDFCPSDDPAACDPGQADSWGPERTIGGDLLTWLCTNPEAVGFISHKGVQIRGARITGAIDLAFADLRFPIVLLRCRLDDIFDLRYASLKTLALTDSHTGSLLADGAKIEGGVFLNQGFEAYGEIRFLGATIGGNLECNGGKFINPGGDTLSADGAKIEGDVFLRNSKIQGRVRLLGATIRGNLECSGAKFVSSEGYALLANRATVEGSVFLDEGFKAQGRVSLVSAEISGFFHLRGAASPESFSLDLESAAVGTLRDEPSSWPSQGNPRLNGFTYAKIARDAPRDSKSRIDWLRRQPQDTFHPQPYEFLARTLKEEGAIRAAKRVSIAKSIDMRRARRRKKPVLWRGVLAAWDWFLYVAFGYGYRLGVTWAALALVFLIAGLAVFRHASSNEIMVPVHPCPASNITTDGEKPTSLPGFCPFLYSLDLLAPIPLGYKEHWRTDVTQPGEFTVFCFGIGLTAAGWTLTTLGIATATGILQRRV
ncbi:MAG: hypothetical protein NZ651_06610 [Candidatus Bipolaricaulota bacterium]|nr:hypothetical protein [Candidatus Bipolaricaulota bacterium]MDW8127425.1 hypothetical protein [Candidatus Bipolaricaulota bacterium]